MTDREARIRAYALGWLLRRRHVTIDNYGDAMRHGELVMRMADRREEREPHELRRHHELHDPDQPRAA